MILKKNLLSLFMIDTPNILVSPQVHRIIIDNILYI